MKTFTIKMTTFKESLPALNEFYELKKPSFVQSINGSQTKNNFKIVITYV